MLVRDFLDWDTHDDRRYELVDGEPRAMAPTSNVHGFLQSELGSLLGNHLVESRPGCKVIANPGVVPRLLAAHNFRIPDLAVTCAPVTPGPVMLPDPVVLIEILSPSNQAHTWSNVWAYTSIPSVQEILILHSSRMAAELLSRTLEGAWPAEPAAVTEGDLVLRSLDFRLSLQALYGPVGLAS